MFDRECGDAWTQYHEAVGMPSIWRTMRRFVRRLVQETLNEVLEREMTEFLGAGKSERTRTRQGYRSGYYRWDLTMKVGEIELRVPQERSGPFSTRVFERYQRSEKSLVAALSEMYVAGGLNASGEPSSGGSVRSRVFAGDDLEHGIETGRVPEGVCGTSAGGGISDARYEKVREEGSVRSRAVQITIGIDGAGRRQVLAAEVADRESEGSWTAFLSRLKERGLRGSRVCGGLGRS